MLPVPASQMPMPARTAERMPGMGAACPRLVEIISPEVSTTIFLKVPMQ